MENLENRLQRVEKALKSLSNPIKKMFNEQQQSECHEQAPISLDGKTINELKILFKTSINTQNNSVKYCFLLSTIYLRHELFQYRSIHYK